MNKLRNSLMVAAAVGAGAGVYAETQNTSSSQKIAVAQHQIITTAQHNAAHPLSPNAEYNDYDTAQDAKAIGEAKKLTARRVAKLSFNKAFNEASDVGEMVIDVSDTTKLPVKTVLNETLPKSTITALDKKNVHFTYDSVEFNPISVEAQGNRPAEGYIPLSFSDKPENTTVTRVINGGTINTGEDAQGKTSWGADSKPVPHINIYPLQTTYDGENVVLGANVKAGKSGDHIKSTSFSLVDPHLVPKGVSVEKSHMVKTNHGEEVTARLTDPSNLSLNGQVEVEVKAVESNGEVASAQEDIPYLTPPKFPN